MVHGAAQAWCCKRKLNTGNTGKVFLLHGVHGTAPVRPQPECCSRQHSCFAGLFGNLPAWGGDLGAQDASCCTRHAVWVVPDVGELP